MHNNQIKKFINKSIQDCSDLDYICNELCALIGHQFKLDRCIIAPYDKNSGLFYPKFEFCLNDSVTSVITKDFSHKCENKTLYKIKEALFIDNIEESNINLEFKDCIKKYQIKSIGIVQLFNNSELAGALILHQVSNFRNWEESEIQSLKEIADLISVAVKCNELSTKTTKQRQREVLLEKIISTITNSSDLDCALQTICEDIAHVFNSELAYIVECFDQEEPPYLIKRGEYFHPDLIKYKSQLPTDQESFKFWRDSFINGKNIVIHNVSESGIPARLKERYDPVKGKSILALPIKSDNGYWGGVGLVYQSEYHYWEESEIKLLESITEQLYLAVKHYTLKENIQKQTKREILLEKIINTIRYSLDIDETLQTICEEIAKVFKVEIVSLLEWPDQTNLKNMHKRGEYFAPEALKHIKLTSVDERVSEFWGEQALKGKTIVINNIFDSELPAFMKEAYKNIGGKSILALPIKAENGYWGGIGLTHVSDYHHWTEGEIKLIESIAEQIYLAVKQAELSADTINRSKKERILREAISSIKSTLNVDDIIENTVTEVGQLLQADRCLIIEHDPAINKFLPVKSEYLSSTKYKSNKGLSIEDYPEFTNIIRNRQDLIVVNSDKYKTEYNIFGTKSEQYIKEYQIASGFALPILYSDQLLGAIVIHYTNSDRRLTSDNVEFARTLANQIGIAMYQSRLYNTVKQTAEQELLIRKVTGTIRQSLELDETLKLVSKEITELFKVQRIIISDYLGNLFPPKNQFYEFKIDNVKGIESIDNFKMVGELWHKLLSDRKTLAISDTLKSDFHPTLQELYKTLNVKSILSVSLEFNNVVWGGITIYDYKNYRNWNQSEITLLKTLSDQIAIAIKQASLYSTIKKQTEKETLLRSDDSILINKHLAKYLGLSCALAYQTLKNQYEHSKYDGTLLKNGFIEDNIQEITGKIPITELEFLNSLAKLYDFKLIDYNYYAGKKLSFKILENKDILNNILYKQSGTLISDNYQEIDRLGNNILPIFDLIKTYKVYFPADTISAVKHLLLSNNQYKSIKELRVSNLVFLVLCKTFDHFMTQNHLDLTKMNNITDEWLSNKRDIKNSNIVNFGATNKILINNLKKILAYRFHEANLTATDFSSKLDLYSHIYFDLDSDK